MKKASQKKTSRKKINSGNQIVLAAESAGMCNYPGCLRVLYYHYEDGEVLSNLVELCHIIGESCNGPRGHHTLSKINATNPENIIMLCDYHHKIIDGHESAYLVDRLRKMKLDHRKWIQDRTQNPSKHWTLITSSGNIMGTGTNPLDIELIKKELNETFDFAEVIPLHVEEFLVETNHWNEFKKKQEEWWKNYQDRKEKISKFVVCAITFIPLLIHLGALLRGTPIALFHFHDNSWKWNVCPPELVNTTFFIEDKILEKDDKIEEIALSISISGIVEDRMIFEVLPNSPKIWKFRVNTPDRSWLKYEEQLREFRKLISNFYDGLHSIFYNIKAIHVFYAGPMPLAFLLGYLLNNNMHPKLILYNFSSKIKPNYTKCYEIK